MLNEKFQQNSSKFAIFHIKYSKILSVLLELFITHKHLFLKSGPCQLLAQRNGSTLFGKKSLYYLLHNIQNE